MGFDPKEIQSGDHSGVSVPSTKSTAGSRGDWIPFLLVMLTLTALILGAVFLARMPWRSSDGDSAPAAAPSSTVRPTVTPRPTATPRPTVTPRPTATPRPTVTPRPTATPKPSTVPRVTTAPRTTPKQSDPYDVGDYVHPDDFNYDHYDDFFDYEDAEDYWEDHQ